jgi:hypothetical protein
MGYIRLERYNDWGTNYLSLPGEGTSGPFRTANFKNAIKVQDGQLVHVRWPDNSQTIETIAHHEFRSSYGDHGHTYEARYKIPGFEVDSHGIKQFVPLDHVDVLAEDLAVASKPEPST